MRSFASRKIVARAAGCIAAVASGCATVDPTHDYQRAAEYASDATGYDRIYDPQRAAEDDRLIEEWLADGLTADEAARIALLNNPRLQAAAMRVGMARADLVQSGLLSNPTLGVSLRLPSGGGLANIEANLAQNIADIWQIPVRRRSAQADLDAAIIDLARQAAQLAADTKTAYLKAVGADQLHAVASENRDTIRQVYDAATSRRDAGAGTDLDVNLAYAPVIDAEVAVIMTRLDAAQERRRLATLLGLADCAADLELIDQLSSVPWRQIDAESLVDAAYASRLDIDVARRSVVSAGQRYELEMRRVFPNLQIGVGFERNERRREGGRKLLADTARASIANGSLTAPGIQPRSARNTSHASITGPTLSLELPVFDQNQAQIAKAEYAWQQSIKELAAVERAMIQEVRGAADRAQTAWQIVDVYAAQSMPLAEKNLSLARDSYSAGKSSLLSVLEAQRFYLQTRTQYIKHLATAAATIPELEAAVNMPLEKLLKVRARDRDAAAAIDPANQGARK